MKKLLLTVSLILLAAPMWAQADKEADQKRYGKGKMPRNDKGEVVFSRVVQEEGYDKKTLYKASKLCIIELFNSAKDVIQLDDPESGIIIVKGLSEQMVTTNYKKNKTITQTATLRYTLKIQAKQNRYKIDIYQIKGHYPGGMVSGVYWPPQDTPAEMLTYDLCFNPNGEIKPMESFYRRAIIDCCNPLLNRILETIHNNLKLTSADESDDW